MRNRRYTNLLAIQPLAVAMGQAKGIEYALLLEKAATGKTIKHWMKDYSEEQDIEKKNNIYKIIEKAFAKAGKALAEFHAEKSVLMHNIPACEIDRFIQKKKMIFEEPFIMHALKEDN